MKWFTVFFTLLGVVVALHALDAQGVRPNRESSSKERQKIASNTTGVQVEIFVATLGTIARPLIYTARLEPYKRIPHSALFAGVVQKVNVANGGSVAVNKIVLTAKRRAIGKSFGSYRVQATHQGRLDDLRFEAGMEFKAGEKLFEIIDDRRLKAEVWVSDKDRNAIVNGQQVKITSDSHISEGQVRRIALIPRGRSALFAVEVLLKEGEGEIGHLGRFDFSKGAFEGIVIDKRAVVSKFGKPHVYIYDDSAESIALLREIVLGPTAGIRVAVKEGIQAGQKIIRNSTSELSDGMRIRLKEKRRGRRRRR